MPVHGQKVDGEADDAERSYFMFDSRGDGLG